MSQVFLCSLVQRSAKVKSGSPERRGNGASSGAHKPKKKPRRSKSHEGPMISNTRPLKVIKPQSQLQKTEIRTRNITKEKKSAKEIAKDSKSETKSKKKSDATMKLEDKNIGDEKQSKAKTKSNKKREVIDKNQIIQVSAKSAVKLTNANLNNKNYEKKNKKKARYYKTKLLGVTAAVKTPKTQNQSKPAESDNIEGSLNLHLVNYN